MKIEKLSEDKKTNTLVISVSDINPSYANAIRRLMLSEVPTMTIEDVEIRKNSSILYDEMIAHRLGLIPLTTDLKAYNLRDECTCKGAGCAKCTLKLTISEKGPKSVISKDIKTKDPKVKPTDDNFIIANLLENQELEVEATAILGKGKEHSKWAPGHIIYRYTPSVKINSQPKNPEAIKEICAFDVFDVKSGKLSVKNEINCTLCNACTDVAKEELTISSDDTKYIFTIESWGQLSPSEIVKKAIEAYDEKIKGFEALLK